MDVRTGYSRLQESLRYNWKALQRSKVAYSPDGSWGLNMLSLKNYERADGQKKQAKKLDRELRYFVTFDSLLASSRVGVYTIFTTIPHVDLFPLMRVDYITALKRHNVLRPD